MGRNFLGLWVVEGTPQLINSMFANVWSQVVKKLEASGSFGPPTPNGSCI